MDFSTAPLAEPDLCASIPLFGSIDQRPSESKSDACGVLSSCRRFLSEASRPVCTRMGGARVKVGRFGAVPSPSSAVRLP